ncbi:MAG: sigma-54-dependent Fis family transcriptional regulator, partial [Gammaproteobacteria bacterium]
MTAPHLLVVDDDESLLRLLELRLTARHYRVTTATSGDMALKLFRQAPADLVLTDLRMDGLNGIQLLEQLHALDSTLPVVIMTAHGSIPEAVDATQKGVVAFLTKPLDTEALESVLAQHCQPHADTAAPPHAPVSTRNPHMRSLLETAVRVAQSDVHVLITGESGTGKEVFARLIHSRSHRHAGEFVAVNCGALPEGLMEAELFGYVKGAFTGATRARDGLFRQASGGTLFLDEIGEMPLPLQVKLLRALQDKQVRPVGADTPVCADARIISATHVDLEQA